MLLTHCKTLRINFLNIFHPDQLICCNLMKWVTKTTVQTRAQNDSAESWGNKDKMEKWSNREEKSKDFPMTLSSSPHSSVWTLDPLDQFMAKVWAKDEKRSEKNHLICKFRNDCVLGTRMGAHPSRQCELKLSQKGRSRQKHWNESKKLPLAFLIAEKSNTQQ